MNAERVCLNKTPNGFLQGVSLMVAKHPVDIVLGVWLLRKISS